MTEYFDVDFSRRYRVAGYDGVAWRALRYDTEQVEIVNVEDEEVWYGEYEEVENRDKVVCIMIGDDREFTHDVYDLTILGDNEYCQECGQIGCGWHVLED